MLVWLQLKVQKSVPFQSHFFFSPGSLLSQLLSYYWCTLCKHKITSGVLDRDNSRCRVNICTTKGFTALFLTDVLFKHLFQRTLISRCFSSMLWEHEELVEVLPLPSVSDTHCRLHTVLTVCTGHVGPSACITHCCLLSFLPLNWRWLRWVYQKKQKKKTSSIFFYHRLHELKK